MWDRAVAGISEFIPLFVGWNELEEYQMQYTGFELTEEEKELQGIYKLTVEQLTWRRWCIENNCGGDTELFKQEYPINPQEAFISTGACVFDKEKVINRLQTIPKPIKVGYFAYEYNDELPAYGARDYFGNVVEKCKISNIRWVDDKDGPIKLYKLPKQLPDTKFCIGGDTAGEGSDRFTGHVLDAKTGEQVAVLHQQTDADLYTKQMYCLGMYFRQALIGIEANFDSFPLRELERLGYPNQYVREKIDEYTGRTEKKYGFKTTINTRPTIISNLVQVVREDIESIHDRTTLEEMLTFVKNKKGRAEAQQGAHDDNVMGLAIAHEIKAQVVFIWVPIIQVQKKNAFKQKVENMDCGEKIEVI